MATVAELEKKVAALERSLEDAVRRLSEQSNTALTATSTLRGEVSAELQKIVAQFNEALKKSASLGVKTDRF